MIETKIYNILKYLFFKSIPCFNHFKSFEKLNFFYRCDLDAYSYGGYVYRKEDEISKIYYLVKGQIQITKCVDEKEIKLCTLYEGSFFGTYEFGKNQIKRILNAQSYSNETVVLCISLDMVS
jgi:signal-transduction protein with cAMP-binding, CBS, and nucleotidyltransferase domain